MRTDEDLLTLATLVDRLAIAHRRLAMGAAAAEGLPENLAEALWMLGGSDASPSMRELAKDLRCDPSNATVLIGQLESRGLVVRVADAVDRRRRLVALTDAGFRVVTTMAHAATAASPMRSLSKEQQAVLIGALATIPVAAGPSEG